MDDEPGRARWLMLAVLLTTSALLVLDLTVLTVAVPTIQRELRAPLTSVQWVLSGYSLTYASLLVLGGRLGDMFGSRRAYLGGIAVWGIGSFIGSLAHSAAQLVIGKALIGGIAAALMTPATLSLLSRSFHGRRRVLAFSAWGTVSGGAAAFGPFIGGYLTTYHSWRWALRLGLLVSIVAFAVGWVAVPTGERRARCRLDVVGALLVASGSFTLVFALTQGPAFGFLRPLESHPAGIVPALFAASVVLLVGFIVVEITKEKRGASPLVAFSQVAGSRSFRYGVLTNFFLAFGQFGFMLCISVYLQKDRGFDAFDAGLRLLPYGAMIFVGARVAASIGRTVHPVRVLRAGAVISTLGMLMLALATRPSTPVIILTTVVYGLGTGFMTGKLMVLALSDIEPGEVGMAGGAYSTMLQIGASLGFAIVGSAVATGETRAAIVICAVGLAMGFLGSLLVPEAAKL
jgi:MFS family permease